MRPIDNMPEKDRVTDMGNMHKNLVNIARVVSEISCLTDTQTHRQTQSSQYFAIAPAGEVIKLVYSTVKSEDAEMQTYLFALPL